jgi:cell division protein FtsI (penicillin-binding protein 3)
VKSKEQIIRVYIIYISVVMFALAVLFRVVYLQFISGADLKAEVEKSTVKMVSIQAPQGNVFADNNQKTSLALSVPRYDIFMDLKTVTATVFDAHVLALADSLSDLYSTKSAFEWEQELLSERKRGNQYFSIRKDASLLDLKRMESFPIFSLGQFKGGFIKIPKTVRVQPYGLLARRTIGYSKNEAKVGIEGYYSMQLQGADGNVLMERSGGGWKPVPSDLSSDPIPGSDVYTTIDVNLQDVAENALEKQMINQDALWGCAVLLEVKTGYVKAIANLSQDTTDNTFSETFNHAVGTATEPGSTFKLASLMVALDDGKIRITDSVNMPGKYCYYGSCLHDSRPGGYGKGTIQYAFEKSSNVVSQIINDNYGSSPQEFVNGLKSIGLNNKLGLDISGEDSPLIKDASDETFSGISIPWMSIGYEVLQTPMQTLAFYNAVANGGRMMKPQFVKEIRDGHKVVEKFAPIVLNPAICKASTLADVQKMLEGVVLRGTARNIRARGFSIAGKTGTAKIAQAGVYSNKYQASFVGYFPADNPKYSCIVVIQGPNKQIYGAEVSGTVFKEIANKVYAMGRERKATAPNEDLLAMLMPYSKSGSKEELKSVFSTMGVSVKDNSGQSAYSITRAGDKSVEIQNRIIEKDVVPSLVGMGLVDAMFIAESQGLVVQCKGSGVVVNQSIIPGSVLSEGDLIILDLR